MDGMLSFECDECGDTTDTDETEVVDAARAFKAKGGSIFRRMTRPTKWRHFCSDCKDCA